VLLFISTERNELYTDEICSVVVEILAGSTEKPGAIVEQCRLNYLNTFIFSRLFFRNDITHKPTTFNNVNRYIYIYNCSRLERVLSRRTVVMVCFFWVFVSNISLIVWKGGHLLLCVRQTTYVYRLGAKTEAYWTTETKHTKKNKIYRCVFSRIRYSQRINDRASQAIK